MQSRRVNLSTQQTSNSSVFFTRINPADLSCSITRELFFDPVLAIPCGHGFEGRVICNLSTCPSCRENIKGFCPALQTRNILDSILSEKPELYSEVYFNIYHFAEIVRENKLATPTGLRFIKLLQYSKNYLNDRLPEGSATGKNAIEILISTRAGRELLRNDKKIHALISEESMQMTVRGKTIQEWLNPENEEQKEEKEQRINTAGFFANVHPSAVPNHAVAENSLPDDDTAWHLDVYGI